MNSGFTTVVSLLNQNIVSICFEEGRLPSSVPVLDADVLVYYYFYHFMPNYLSIPN